jgi:hypothetical protein
VEASNVEVELDCLVEEATKKRKIPLEELRAWLELSCRPSQGSADTALEMTGGLVFPSSVSWRKKETACIGGPSCVTSCYYGEVFLN